MSVINPDALYDVDEAAEALRLKAKDRRRAMRALPITGTRVHRTLTLYKGSDLLAYLDRQRDRPPLRRVG